MLFLWLGTCSLTWFGVYAGSLIGRRSSTYYSNTALLPSSRQSEEKSQASSSGGWPTEHHDSLNTGSTEFIGPGNSASGDCLVSFFDLPEDTPIRFYSTGVTSATPGVNAHFFGGSDNIARVVEKYSTRIDTNTATVSTTVNVSACNLTSLAATASPAAPYGLVSSATSWTALDGFTDLVAFASSDGVTYALNWKKCAYANSSFCSSSSYEISPKSNFESTVEASAPRLSDYPCRTWTFKSPVGFPFLTPPRYIYPSVGPPLILVSDTAPGGLYVGGTTYALNSETGTMVWNHSHSAYNGTSWGAVGSPPAFDSVDEIIFLTYGPGIVALSTEGTVLGKWSGAGDLVVASPSLVVGDFGSSWGVFLHTSLGTLWRLDVIQDSVTKAVTFTPKWKCDYTLASYWATGNGICTRSFTFDSSAEDEIVEVPFPATPSSSQQDSSLTFSARRGDFAVAGGWYQATTLLQRNALWASIRKHYAAAFPFTETSLVTPEILSHFPQSAIQAGLKEMLEVAFMSKDLPISQLQELYSGEDWGNHPDASIRGFLKYSGGVGVGEYSASFPVSTPTLVSSGEIAFSQFNPIGGGRAGLYSISSLDGSILWGYSNVTIFGTTIQFGRSRSSPASDGFGYLYASSDSDFFVNDTLPYVLAFQKTGTRYTLQWLTNLGQAQVNTLGSASPIVRSGLTNDEAEVYSSSYTGAVAIVAGQSCPFYKGVECGPNNGVCNCATGKCACQPLLYCNQGPGCGDTCNGNGECSLVRGGTFSCKCSPCWTGPTCSQYSQSSCSPSNSFLKTPAGQAAVGVPVTLLLLCIIGIAMWRVMYPNAPWASLFPKWLGCCGPHSESAPLLAAGDDSVEKSTGKGYGLVPQIPGQVESTL